MKTIIIFAGILFVFAIVLSFWIAPLYEENQTFSSYIETAFVQCIEQKIDAFAKSLEKHGGYTSQEVGIANELIIEQEIENNLGEFLGSCEELLKREDLYVRELKSVRVVLGQEEISVFFDGRWISKTGKIIPGFVARISYPLLQHIQQAHEAIQLLEERGILLEKTLASLGKDMTGNEIKENLQKNVENTVLGEYNVSLNVVDVSADSIRRNIRVVLTGTVGAVQFFYPMSFNARDLLVGCEITTPKRLPFAKEILFDCGWYSCMLSWKENLFIPRLCAKAAIYLDGVLYE